MKKSLDRVSRRLFLMRFYRVKRANRCFYVALRSGYPTTCKRSTKRRSRQRLPKMQQAWETLLSLKIGEISVRYYTGTGIFLQSNPSCDIIRSNLIED